MFSAEKSNDVTIKMYLDIVSQIVEDKDDTYKSLIDKILLETAEAARGKKKLNDVDSSIRYIVNKLYNTNGDYFAKTIHSLVDTNIDVYRTLRSILTTLSSEESRNLSTNDA